MPCLTIHLPGAAPVSHVLKDEATTVGRMKGNSIVIDDASISLMHARITRRAVDFFVKDLNSTNGTLVNGQPITEARLRDQDRLRFADVNAMFELADAPVPAVSVVAPTANPLTPSVTLQAPPAAPAPRAVPTPVAVNSRSASPAQNRKVFSRPAVAACVAAVFAVVATAIFLLLRGNSNLGAERIEAKSMVVPAKPVANASARRPAPSVSTEERSETARPNLDPVTTPVDPNQRISDLANLLQTGDIDERRQAAAALHGLTEKPEGAEPALLAALKDSDAEVKMWAALTLVKNQVYNSNCIPVLITGLHHEDPVVRQVVCLSLGLIPYEPSDKAAVGAALAEAREKDSDPEVRTMAQSALGVIAPELVLSTPTTTGAANP